jgi:hypothetical protein
LTFQCGDFNDKQVHFARFELCVIWGNVALLWLGYFQKVIAILR